MLERAISAFGAQYQGDAESRDDVGSIAGGWVAGWSPTKPPSKMKKMFSSYSLVIGLKVFALFGCFCLRNSLSRGCYFTYHTVSLVLDP